MVVCELSGDNLHSRGGTQTVSSIRQASENATMKPLSTDEARSKFFDETEGAVSVFRKSGWTGCVLDGDKYGAHRMSRLLWDLITTCCNHEVWHVYGYRPVGEPDTGPVAMVPVWEAFSFRNNPAIEFPEWVALDDTCQWAILAEYDVTVFGCSEQLAVRANAFLERHATSFRKMSEDNFPGHESWAFFKAVFSGVRG